MKIFTIANVPDWLAQAWLQHLRDFDAKYEGCHFEVGLDVPNKSLAECVEMLRINPELSFTQIFERKQP